MSERDLGAIIKQQDCEKNCIKKGNKRVKGKDLCCKIYAVFPKKNPPKADGIVHVTQN